MHLCIIKSLVLTFFLLLFIQPNHSWASLKPPIQLATSQRENIDIRQYWVSEKLDGVRAYWDGKRLISRQGNVFAAPDWFIADFPAQSMDGELWIGRGQFDLVSGTVRQSMPDNRAWRKVRFMIFDLPKAGGTFTARVMKMRRIVAQAKTPYLKAITQFKLADLTALENKLESVVKDGGEGLMLHRGEAIYTVGRSEDIMKVKKYQDAEAIVLAYLPGKGKYTGMMGALLVKDDNGIVFKLGSGFSDTQRAKPPAIGSRVTYKFYGKTKNNKPRFASFLRVRVE